MRQVSWEVVKAAIIDYGRAYTHNDHSREIIKHVELALSETNKRKKKRRANVVHNGVRGGMVLRSDYMAVTDGEVL